MTPPEAGIGTAPAAPGRRWSPRGPGVLGALLFPAGVAVVAALVFGSGLGRLPLWRDEAASLAIAGRPVVGILAAAGRVDVVHTAYYLLLHPLLAVGDGEAWVRLPSLMGAVAATVLAAELARRRLGSAAAVVTCALLLGNPWLAFYAREARPYAPATALVAAAAFALLGGPPTRRRRVASTVLGVLATWLHLFAVLPVLGLLAAHALLSRPRRRSGPGDDHAPGVAAWAWCAAVLVAAAAPLALLAAAEARQVSWVARPTVADVRTLLGDATGSLGGTIVVVGALATAGLTAAFGAASPGGRSARAVPVTALVGALTGPVVLLGVSRVATPLYVERYVLAGLPLLALATGAAVQVAAGALRSPRLRRLGVGALAALALTGVPAAVAGPPDKTEDLRAAAAHLAAAARTGDCVAYDPSWARIGLTHYLDVRALPAGPLRDVALDPGPAGQHPVGLFPAERPLPGVEARLHACARVWVAGYPGPVGRWRPTPEVTGAALAAVADGFTADPPADFGDFRLVLWTARR